MFDNAAEAKKDNWFSRRHRTREAHDNAVAHFRSKTNENHAPEDPHDPTRGRRAQK